MSDLELYSSDEYNNGVWYLLKLNPDLNINIDTLVFIPKDIDRKRLSRISVIAANTGSPPQIDSTKKPNPNLNENEKILEIPIEERKERFFPKYLSRFGDMVDIEKGQNSILVYPVIVQRTNGEYYQQLTKAALEPGQPEGFERIDKQVLTAIDTIREQLSSEPFSINTYPDIDMLGQSASGSFSRRFTFLHLDRVHLSYSNGAKDAITLPVESIKNIRTGEDTPLPYPLGIADICEYYKDNDGKYEFDGMKYDEPDKFMEAYKKRLKDVPFLLTYGNKEDEKGPHHIHGRKIVDHPTQGKWGIIEDPNDPIINGSIVIGNDAQAYQAKENILPENTTSKDDLIPVSTYDMTFIRSIIPLETAIIMRECIGKTPADRMNRTQEIWKENGLENNITIKEVGTEENPVGHGTTKETVGIASKFVDDVSKNTLLLSSKRALEEKAQQYQEIQNDRHINNDRSRKERWKI